MRIFRKCLGTGSLCFLMVFSGIGSAQIEVWESDEGHAVEAEFIRIIQGAVELKKQDGGTVQVPMTRLSEGSRERAEVLWETKAKFFPRHVFQMQTFDFAIFNDGKMKLQPMHAGVPRGDPIPIRFNGGYIPRPGAWKARPVLYLSEPEISANSLNLKLELAEGIEVTIQCEVESDTLTIGYQVIEPDGVNKGKYQVILSMPEIVKSNLDTKLMEGPFLKEPAPFESIKPYLEGIKLRAASEKRTENLTFMDSPNKINRPQNYIMLTDALGPNSTFKVESGKNGYIIHFIYSGKSFWSGYDLYLQKNEDDDPAMGSSNEFKLKLTY